MTNRINDCFSGIVSNFGSNRIFIHFLSMCVCVFLCGLIQIKNLYPDQRQAIRLFLLSLFLVLRICRSGYNCQYRCRIVCLFRLIFAILLKNTFAFIIRRLLLLFHCVSLLVCFYHQHSISDAHLEFRNIEKLIYFDLADHWLRNFPTTTLSLNCTLAISQTHLVCLTLSLNVSSSHTHNFIITNG